MKNLSNYHEILIQKQNIKPHYLWLMPYGTFVDKNRNFKRKSVLDFGCDINSSAYKQFLAQNGGQGKGYFGFDVSSSVVRWLEQQGSFHDFWKNDTRRFDVINASEVYEHLNKDLREEFLKRSYQLLKPGGTLYIDIPYIANLNIIEFFRRDRTHEAVACEDEALYIMQFGFQVQLYVGGYTIPYYGKFHNAFRILTNLALGYKPFLVTFIVATRSKTDT